MINCWDWNCRWNGGCKFSWLPHFLNQNLADVTGACTMVCIDACKNMGQVVLSCKTPSNSNPVCECSPDKENKHCAAYCPAECQKKNQTVLSCDAVSKECECSPGIQLLSTGVVYHRYFIICKSYKYSNVTCFWRNFLLCNWVKHINFQQTYQTHVQQKNGSVIWHIKNFRFARAAFSIMRVSVSGQLVS